MPNGKDYVLFYLKLLVESISHNGELRFSETIPYNEDMLSTITNTNIDVVRSAMKIFLELNMIELYDDSTIFMSEVNKLIGGETTAAERMRRLRQQKSVTMFANVQKRYTDIDIEKEKDIEIDKEPLKENIKRKVFKKPAVDEVKEYCKERKNNINAENFVNFYEAKGWVIGKTPMKDWKAAIRTWEAKDKESKKVSDAPKYERGDGYVGF